MMCVFWCDFPCNQKSFFVNSCHVHTC